MKKYLMLVVCSAQYVSAMDTIPTKMLFWDSEAYRRDTSYNPCEVALLDLLQQYSFRDSVVFAYDGFEAVAEQIAKTALVVHVDSTNLKKLEAIKQEYAHVKNLIFTEPQKELYDCIVMCDPHKLTQDSIQIHLTRCRSLLKSSGKLVTVMRLVTDPCVLEQTFDQLYPTIHAAIAPETRAELPNTLNSNNKFLSYDQLMTTSKCLFVCESQETKKYDIVIKNTRNDLMMYCHWIATSLARGLQEFEISDTTMQALQRQFIDLLQQLHLKNNAEGHLLHPFSFTELVWHKWILQIPLQKLSKGKIGNK